MSNNDFERDAAARLRSLARALNEPTEDVDSMSDEQVRVYLAENGHDTATLRDALTERMAQLKAQRAQIDDARSMQEEKTESKPERQNPTISELRARLDELNIKVRVFAEAINVPFGTASELIRGHLYELPDKLIHRVAKICQMNLDDTTFMLGRIPALQPQKSMLLRSRGSDGNLHVERKTFREVMLRCKETSDLTPAQEEDWKEELRR